MRFRRVLLSVTAGVAILGAVLLSRAPAQTVDMTATTTTTGTPAPVATQPSTSTSTVATTTAPTPPTTAPSTRAVGAPAWAPFADAGGVSLVHPAARVERVAFHQSNHEGAQHLGALPTTYAPTLLEARRRLTDGQTAADIVVAPDAEIRSPVTGRVKRAGTYTLYCKHRDDYLVIVPDANPAWEVKLLHIDRVAVRSGQRVVAGVTVIAPRATQLPFESQVDELRTADPAWPHVHIEVVDPAIRNVQSPGSSC